MKKYEVYYIDCVGSKGKNLQKLNSIEIWYYIDNQEYYAIEYNFHNLDFEIWKQVIDIHMEDVIEASLYNEKGQKVNIKELENNDTYYTFTLRSKCANLYRNINLILFLEKGEINNMSEMMLLNLWKN